MTADTQALTSAVVHQWQCDHFGHLNVRHYAAIFDDSIFIFWGRHGLSRDDGIAPVTAEFKISFHAEILVGSVVTVRSRVLRIGSKSVALALEMVDELTRELRATCEIVEVFFSLKDRESRPIPGAMRERLVALVDPPAGGHP